MEKANDLIEGAGIDLPVVEKQFEGNNPAENAETEPKKETPAKAETAAEGDTQSEDAGSNAGSEGRKPGSVRSRERVRSLEAQVLQLRRELETERGEKLKAPTLEQFEYDSDKFDAAKAEFQAEVTARRVRQALVEDRAGSLEAERFQAIQDDHLARIQEARAKITDYDEVLKKGSEIRFPDQESQQRLNSAIIESEKSDLLLYHLASRPEVALELSQMSPVQMARRIGQIEARLSYPNARTETKAPPPVSGLRGGAVPSKDPDSMSHEDFKRMFSRK